MKGAEISGEKTSSYPKTAVDLHRFGQKTPCSKILYTFNYLFTTSKTIEVDVYSTSASQGNLSKKKYPKHGSSISFLKACANVLAFVPAVSAISSSLFTGQPMPYSDVLALRLSRPAFRYRTKFCQICKPNHKLEL